MGNNLGIDEYAVAVEDQQGHALSQRVRLAFAEAIWLSLRAPRSAGITISARTRAGLADRAMSRSASWAASSRSCVTRSVVTGLRATNRVNSSRSRAASGAS